MVATTRQFHGKCQCEEIWHCCEFCNPEAYRKSIEALAEHKAKQAAEHTHLVNKLAKEIARKIYEAQHVYPLNMSGLTKIIYLAIKDKVKCR